jgi:hypothetical protein
MIQVGKTYKTVGGQNVQIMAMTTTATDIVFTGDNGVWYDRFGRTERGHDLSLILVTVAPAYEDEPLTKNEQVLLRALKELLAVECIDDYTSAHQKARDVIAKFERVGGSE